MELFSKNTGERLNVETSQRFLIGNLSSQSRLRDLTVRPISILKDDIKKRQENFQKKKNIYIYIYMYINVYRRESKGKVKRHLNCVIFNVFYVKAYL